MRQKRIKFVALLALLGGCGWPPPGGYPCTPVLKLLETTSVVAKIGESTQAMRAQFELRDPGHNQNCTAVEVRKITVDGPSAKNAKVVIGNTTTAAEGLVVEGEGVWGELHVLITPTAVGESGILSLTEFQVRQVKTGELQIYPLDMKRDITVVR